MSYNISSNITFPAGAAGTTLTAGSPSYTITSNGSSWNWANVANVTTSTDIKGSTLQVNGDAEITGNLTVQGVKLSERLERIEERLAILRPNEEMEQKWDKLRGLRQAYMELEAEIKEKEEIWKILKK